MYHLIKQLSTENEGELKEALTLVQDVFHEFEAPDYSNEGIEHFKQYISFDTIKQQIVAQDLIVWAYFANGTKITGMIALRLPNHISLLFVDKRFHKQGIARQLLETAFTYCQTVHNATQVTLNSSPYALDVYKHLGFVPTDNQHVIDGIIFTPMKKIL
ncbi:GNAT family N-acetyltransferase [Enterococcus caccae]|uniref:N-acetyltransferase domain-containing protein n=1 Tax=Enterococcus caccae ATCC BAA-1240 TaxID=1158612 RepID=R3WB64_9ENTE|nr:GNAT family N-acetyltransferase [Enterococcus caccae]EOL45166.1 hypothetical protein UC7_01972 [Enterococcus caccae ATCC BAA-1240]EOT58573.1 hypothetical protein I580_02744 [Enterococcus caccae ATCC BAA-1240]OJG27098.1 hypothetical protein RU98_GL002878 [Enterococcus caccae]